MAIFPRRWGGARGGVCLQGSVFQRAGTCPVLGLCRSSSTIVSIVFVCLSSLLETIVLSRVACSNMCSRRDVFQKEMRTFACVEDHSVSKLSLPVCTSPNFTARCDVVQQLRLGLHTTDGSWTID